MSMLEKAISIAVKKHWGVRDKGGFPYILHPLRLMNAVTTEDEKIVAVLHDVVEDTDMTLEELSSMGFSNRIIKALRLLTHEKGVSYEAYVAALCEDDLARAVKIQDLEDNMDMRRLKDITDKDWERLKKYKKAWALLTFYKAQVLV